jgi:hypothetical protein
VDDVVLCVCDPVVVEDGVGFGGVVDQSVENELVVRPLTCVAEIEIGGVTTLGCVLAEVFEVLCVAEVPPLADGEL